MIIAKINQHYVPQFYLRNFSEDKKSIGMYNIKHGKFVKNASIKKQASKDYLYGDDGVLEDWFHEVETTCAVILKKILKTESLPAVDSEEYHNLLLFLLLSEARTLKTADSMNNFIDHLSKEILQMSPGVKLTPEEIQKLSIGMNVPNSFSIDAVINIYPILLDLKAVLLKINTDRSFITTDNPLTRYNLMYVLKKYKLRGYGLGNMGIQLFFPISPKLGICIFDSVMYRYPSKKDPILELRNGKQVDEINKLLFLNAYDSIFYNSSNNEDDIRRVVEKNIPVKKSQIESEVNRIGPTGHGLFIFSHKGVTEKIKLPFRLRRKFKKMPLPPHMGGPLRPYAQSFMEMRDRISNKD